MADSQAKSQQPDSAQRAGDDEIDLLNYLRVIWRYRWMILVLCVIAMSLTVVVTVLRPRQYQSAVTIVPPLDVLQKESSSALGALNNSLLRQMMDTAAGSIAKMYVEILQSREVADALIDQFHLMEVYERIKYRADARKQLQKNTKVATTEGGAVKVIVLDRDPQRAAALAGAYVEELDRQNKRLSTGQATSKRIFLENRLKEVESKLSKIDNILSREAKTQENLYDLLVTQYEMAKIEEARSMPTIQVLDPAAVAERPVSRGLVVKCGAATVLAMLLGVCLAFRHDYMARLRRGVSGALTRPTHGSKGSAAAEEPGP